MNFKFARCFGGYNFEKNEIYIRYGITFDNVSDFTLICESNFDCKEIYLRMYCYKNYKSIPKYSYRHYGYALAPMGLLFDEDGKLYWSSLCLVAKGNTMDYIITNLLASIKDYNKKYGMKKIPITDDYELKFNKDEDTLSMECGDKKYICRNVSYDLKSMLGAKHLPFYYFQCTLMRLGNTVRLFCEDEPEIFVYKFSPNMLDRFYSIAEGLIS